MFAEIKGVKRPLSRLADCFIISPCVAMHCGLITVNPRSGYRFTSVIISGWRLIRSNHWFDLINYLFARITDLFFCIIRGET